MGVHEPAVWIGFSVLVVGLLVLDLGVLNRKSHVLSFREALSWSTGLVTLALLFGVFLWVREGTQTALEYYTGYLIELSLSVDNLFVFLLIFQYFAVPAELQPRILKWGILGALVMRAIMIALGALLLQQFTWIIYVFGGILIVTGHPDVPRLGRPDRARAQPAGAPGAALRADDGRLRRAEVHRPRHPAAGWRRRSSWCCSWWSGRDLVFAIDSIPAIFAVTRDPFIVYSSNVFAILGLRALFFVLAGMMDRFEYLKPGVAAILVFVGFKMLFNGLVPHADGRVARRDRGDPRRVGRPLDAEDQGGRAGRRVVASIFAGTTVLITGASRGHRRRLRGGAGGDAAPGWSSWRGTPSGWRRWRSAPAPPGPRWTRCGSTSPRRAPWPASPSELAGARHHGGPPDQQRRHRPGRPRPTRPTCPRSSAYWTSTSGW